MRNDDARLHEATVPTDALCMRASLIMTQPTPFSSNESKNPGEAKWNVCWWKLVNGHPRWSFEQKNTRRKSTRQGTTAKCTRPLKSLNCSSKIFPSPSQRRTRFGRQPKPRSTSSHARPPWRSVSTLEVCPALRCAPCRGRAPITNNALDERAEVQRRSVLPYHGAIISRMPRIILTTRKRCSGIHRVRL